MYVIISIIKIQPVTVVEAWEIISLFVCAQTNTSVLSSCLQQSSKYESRSCGAVKCSVMLSFAGSLSTHWSICAGASAQGSQGADCSSCFWVQGLGQAALFSAKFPPSVYQRWGHVVLRSELVNYEGLWPEQLFIVADISNENKSLGTTMSHEGTRKDLWFLGYCFEI